MLLPCASNVIIINENNGLCKEFRFLVANRKPMQRKKNPLWLKKDQMCYFILDNHRSPRSSSELIQVSGREEELLDRCGPK